ncbi:hypothetical protein IFM89_015531 [Coptis chinensis]|uniref:Uncharacterized protein n=1 Tax=Coptis chinensis TaxID=261450 RepID=A0A835MF83_9MAGN|nr:hypothetical protein IFM89_015531 [Coptis chinensis]
MDGEKGRSEMSDLKVSPLWCSSSSLRRCSDLREAPDLKVSESSSSSLHHCSKSDSEQAKKLFFRFSIRDSVYWYWVDPSKCINNVQTLLAPICIIPYPEIGKCSGYVTLGSKIFMMGGIIGEPSKKEKLEGSTDIFSFDTKTNNVKFQWRKESAHLLAKRTLVANGDKILLVLNNIDVSTHNQYSRSCLVVNHCASSKSFVRIRADMPVDPETQQEAGMIALYRKTHFSEKKGWVSHEAENNYERMVELQNQPTPEGSNPLTEEEIFDEVLGVRPGYKRGLGHGEAPPSRKRVAGYEHPDVDQLRARAEEAESQLEELRGWKEAAQETQATHQAQIQQQQRQLDYLMEKLGGPPSMWYDL